MPSLIDEWAQYLAASGAAKSTIRIRTKTLRALMAHASVTDPLAITRRDCVSFLSRGIAPWSRLTYWSSIKQWVDYVRDFDIDPNYNLLKGIPKPRTPESAARPINDEIVKRLLEVRSSHRAYAYIRLALFAGLRVHEIAQVRGEDFDHEAGWLMVTGKGGVTAPVPLHPEIVKLAGVMPEGGLWFPSRVDPARPVDPMAVSATIVNALRSVGSDATAHQLRDTAATRIQRQVKDIRVTQSMLRHRSVRSTQKYTSVSDESMRHAVTALDWGKAAA